MKYTNSSVCAPAAQAQVLAKSILRQDTQCYYRQEHIKSIMISYTRAPAAQAQVLAKSSALYDPPPAEGRARLAGALDRLCADLGLAADVLVAGHTAL